MDGPVEIELDREPPRSGRGRRSRPRGRAGEPPLPVVAAGSGVAGDQMAGGGVSGHAAEVSGGHAGGPPRRPSAAALTALVGVGGLALVLIGFALGRAGAGDRPSVDTVDAVDAADAAVAGGVGPGGESAEATAVPPTTRAPVDRSLVTLPSSDESVPAGRGTAPAGDESGDESGDDDTEAIRLIELGGPLLESPSGFVVVGLTAEGELAEIDVDRGTLRLAPPVSELRATAGNAFLRVGREATVVGSHQRPGAYRIEAGGEPEPLPDVASWYDAIPGPDPDRFWVASYQGAPNEVDLTLIDIVSGEPVGEPVRVPGQMMWPLVSDGAGHVLSQGVGGTYLVTDGEPRRVTTGRIVGVGSHHLLAVECDEALRCTVVRIDRDGGRDVVAADPSELIASWRPGSVSPDGTALAHVRFDRPRPSVELVDLESGEITAIRSDLRGDRMSSAFYDASSSWAEWSSDGRHLVWLAEGSLSFFDRERGETVTGDVLDELPELVTFGVRPPGGPAVVEARRTDRR